MYLKFYLNDDGQRVYTLKAIAPNGQPTQSAHPARFSPGKILTQSNYKFFTSFTSSLAKKWFWSRNLFFLAENIFISGQNLFWPKECSSTKKYFMAEKYFLTEKCSL